VTKKLIGGYTWNQQIATGRFALQRARRAIEELQQRPTNALIVEIATALLEINETYIELAKIGRANEPNE